MTTSVDFVPVQYSRVDWLVFGGRTMGAVDWAGLGIGARDAVPVFSSSLASLSRCTISVMVLTDPFL